MSVETQLSAILEALHENQLALADAVESIGMWIDQRGGTEASSSILGAVSTLDINSEGIRARITALKELDPNSLSRELHPFRPDATQRNDSKDVDQNRRGRHGHRMVCCARHLPCQALYLYRRGGICHSADRSDKCTALPARAHISG